MWIKFFSCCFKNVWRSTEISVNFCGYTKRKDKFGKHCRSQVEFIPPLLSMARICQLSIKTSHSFSLRGILPLSARQTPALSALQFSLQYQLSGNTTHDAFRRVWHFLSMSLSSALGCSMTQQQKHALHVCPPLVLCSVLVFFYFCIAAKQAHQLFSEWMCACTHAWMKGCVYINDTEVLAYHLVKYSVFGTMILMLFNDFNVICYL